MGIGYPFGSWRHLPAPGASNEHSHSTAYLHQHDLFAEEVMTRAETGVGAATFGSGMAAISAAAKEVGAITIVDSTCTTPYLVRPIEHGFDLVVHGATKYLGGHGDSTAGVAISGQQALLKPLHDYAMMLGATLSPFETNLVSRGLKTLAVRMERHCSNALQVAHFLESHPAVARVHLS